MPHTLAEVVETLRRHEGELRRRGVAHAAIFGSVARGEATAASDVDVLIDLGRPIGVYAFAGIELYLGDVLGTPVDLANRKSVKPRLKDAILRDAVQVF